MRRKVRVRRGVAGWGWYCTLCQPPVSGCTPTWPHTMRNVAGHLSRLACHHRWVAGRYGALL